MMNSISLSTLSQYSSSIKLWWNYCKSKSIHDVLDVKPYDLIDFLTNCFESGASYGTLNNHRSAISLISFNKIGDSDQIKRFFKGVFKMKPVFPRYDITWDPHIVLNFLSNFYPNSELSLEVLSKKLVMLLALASGQRCQTLSLIRVTNIRRLNDRYMIKITDLIKTSSIGKSQPILDLPFFESPNICPADTLSAYMMRTAQIRPPNVDKLILTFRNPHHAVSSQTIGRWIKDVLEESGIDTNTFRAHSTRHAATSAAGRAGISVDVIRKTAGWSQQSAVFANFYNRPVVQENNFVRAVFS